MDSNSHHQAGYHLSLLVYSFLGGDYVTRQSENHKLSIEMR